ncbi:MAG: hypothetical protein ACWIPH_04190 [Ostreibacterium sp.]
MKNQYLFISVIALSLLSACSEEKDQTPTQHNKQKPPVVTNNQSHQSEPVSQLQSSLEQTTQAIAKVFNQQKNDINQSINHISSTLNKINNTDQNELTINPDKINQLAKQLEQFAQQAGQSARILESTTIILGNAIQQGFKEGYKKPIQQFQSARAKETK